MVADPELVGFETEVAGWLSKAWFEGATAADLLPSLEQPLVCNRKIASSDPTSDEPTNAAIFFVPLDFLPLSGGCDFGVEMFGDGFTSDFLSKPSCVNFSICLLRVLVPPVGGGRGTSPAIRKLVDSTGVAGEFMQ